MKLRNFEIRCKGCGMIYDGDNLDVYATLDERIYLYCIKCNVEETL